jgi:predicted nucleotidyltransferase
MSTESQDRLRRFFLDFFHWLERQPEIKAVAMVGSHARREATNASDLDLIIIATDPTKYFAEPGWVGQFGSVSRTRIEHYGKVTSLRVWYADGLEVEYGLTNESWAAIPLDEGTEKVISDGMQVLFERNPMLLRGLNIPDVDNKGSH